MNLHLVVEMRLLGVTRGGPHKGGKEGRREIGAPSAGLERVQSEDKWDGAFRHRPICQVCTMRAPSPSTQRTHQV